MFFDSHCHLDADELARDLAHVLQRAEQAGVCHFVVPGVHPDGWPAMAQMARENPNISVAYGVHPEHAELWDDVLQKRLLELAPQGVAIGEIGLDYLLPVSRERQAEAFRAQLRLAQEVQLPVIIHCRRAFADLLTIIRQEIRGEVAGVMHAFSGSVEIAHACRQLGLLIGVAGPVTFTNAVRSRQVVRSLPLEALLLESDAPDLTPEPKRGSGNEPANLPLIAQQVADIHGASIGEVARQTTVNACQLFDLRGNSSKIV
ncbi:MAG TPA: TatD family hydrolase [Geobacterales bacterium]|nr:TatD family hydrolase [Geobacterales bacterium]